MTDAVRKFAEQFAYQPQIELGETLLPSYEHYVVAGLGGSHLAADLIQMWDPTIPLTVYSDYGLPVIPENQRKTTLVIASSYSGNTEETIDVYREARKQSLPLACLATGGKLLELAVADQVPYIRLPHTGIQPRSALGLSARAVLKLMGRIDILNNLSELAELLHPEEYETAGRALAEWLHNHVPVIYASRRNSSLAYNWKIKMNETGKIPAFYNVLPELNHNEMTGFDLKESIAHLCQTFAFIFLHDDADHPRIQRRMNILAQLYRDRGLAVEVIEMSDDHPYHKTFASLLLADWTAIAIAERYGLESEQVPMVEEFKQLMA